jgi:hypothetical protein
MFLPGFGLILGEAIVPHEGDLIQIIRQNS